MYEIGRDDTTGKQIAGSKCGSCAPASQSIAQMHLQKSAGNNLAYHPIAGSKCGCIGLQWHRTRSQHCDQFSEERNRKVLPSRKLAANPSDVTDAANFVTPDFASSQLPDCTKLPRFATRCLRSLCRNVLVTSL